MSTTTRDLAKVIVTDPAGHILLLRRADDDENRPSEWDFPGGGIEADEDALSAGVRELSEETGITLSADMFRLVYAITSLSPETQVSINRLIFAAKMPTSQAVMLSHEHSAFEWLSTGDALRAFTHPAYNSALQYVVDNGLL